MKGKMKNMRKEDLGLIITFYFFSEKSFRLMWQTVDLCLQLVVGTELPFVFSQVFYIDIFPVCLKCFII